MKFDKAANKSHLFSSVFCSQKWFGTNFRLIAVLKICSEWNSEVFLFWKWFRTEFRGFFSSENSSERNSEVFSLLKMVRNGTPRFFSFENGLERNSEVFFSSEKWFGTEFRGFSLPRNRRNSDGTAACSVLFRIPRNIFRKMATLVTALLYHTLTSPRYGFFWLWQWIWIYLFVYQ